MLAIPNTHRDQQFQPFPRKDPQAVSSVCLWGFLSSTTVRNACCTIHGHLFCLQFGHMTRLGIVAAICISHCFTSFFLWCCCCLYCVEYLLWCLLLGCLLP